MRFPLGTSDSGWKLLAVLALAVAGPASATLVTFDFDSMAYRSSSSPGPNSAVGTYLNGEWANAGMSGTVIATGAGELSNNQYTGDNHVVGPCTATSAAGACRTITSATLGSTEHGVQGGASIESFSSRDPDNYIVNLGGAYDRIVITFPTAIYSVSFDFEIFPDGTCTSLNNCGSNQSHLPDFTLLADGSPVNFLGGSTATVFGIYPGSPGTYSHSPHSSPSTIEPVPQYLGISGDLIFSQGITTLSFVDWPQRIGIDNLVVDPVCEGRCRRLEVPEPPMLPLLALGIGMVAMITRRKWRH